MGLEPSANSQKGKLTPLRGDPRYLADGKWSVTYDLARGLKLSSDMAESQPVIGRRAALSAREQTCTQRPVLRQINLLRIHLRALRALRTQRARTAGRPASTSRLPPRSGTAPSAEPRDGPAGRAQEGSGDTQRRRTEGDEGGRSRRQRGGRRRQRGRDERGGGGALVRGLHQAVQLSAFVALVRVFREGACSCALVRVLWLETCAIISLRLNRPPACAPARAEAGEFRHLAWFSHARARMAGPASTSGLLLGRERGLCIQSHRGAASPTRCQGGLTAP
jgi:hypothetical protein